MGFRVRRRDRGQRREIRKHRNTEDTKAETRAMQRGGRSGRARHTAAALVSGVAPAVRPAVGDAVLAELARSRSSKSCAVDPRRQRRQCGQWCGFRCNGEARRRGGNRDGTGMALSMAADAAAQLQSGGWINGCASFGSGRQAQRTSWTSTTGSKCEARQRRFFSSGASRREQRDARQSDC